MKLQHLALLVLTLMLFFRFGTSTSVLSAAEIDGLVAGSALKAGLERGDSLAQAFSTHTNHPRAKHLRSLKGVKAQDRVHRANLLTPPLVRWIVGGTMAVIGGDALSAARWAAALAMALALGLACFFLLQGAERWWFVGACVVTSATWTFASTAGVSALSCLVMTLLLIALKAMREGRSPLWVGAAWGLTLAVHPATVWFLIPIFVTGAMAYSANEARTLALRAGRVTLPTVPLTLFAVPVVAILLLVALWPTLWKGTANGLFFWITEAWRESAPGQVVIGTSFDQPNDRAPLAWSALVQWSSLLPMSIVLAWGVGVWKCIKTGMRAQWNANMLTATLLLAGAVNGGLFGGRLSIFALLLIPTLLTCAEGLNSLWTPLQTRWRLSPVQAKAICASLAFGLAIIQSLSGTTNLGSSNGLDAATPVPYALLEDVMAAEEDAQGAVPVMFVGGDTLSTRGQERWKHAVWTLSRMTRLDVSIRDAQTSRWLLVLDAEPVDLPDAAVHVIPEGEPHFTHVVSGVRWDAYKL